MGTVTRANKRPRVGPRVVANSRATVDAEIEAQPDRTGRLRLAVDHMRAAVHYATDEAHARAVDALVDFAVDLNRKKVLAGRSVVRDPIGENRWSLRRADQRTADERHAHYLGRVRRQQDRRWRLVAAIDYVRAVGHDAPDAVLDEAVVALVALAERFESRLAVKK